MYDTDEVSTRHAIQLRYSWTSTLWTYIILVSVIQAPFGALGACKPCHSKCVCTEKSDQTCRVNCSGASLSSLPKLDELPAATTITELLLGRNSISTLVPNAFSAFTKLQKLELYTNDLTTLPDGIFQPLTSLNHLDIAENKWTCDCDLLWLKRWLTKNEQIFKNSDATSCNKPSAIQGLLIKKAAESEFVCVPADFVSCHLDEDTGLTIPIFYVDTSAPKGSTKKQCNDHCFRKNHANAVIYNNNCACGVDARTVKTSCSCPNLLSASEPNNGAALCSKKYLSGVFAVKAGINFGAVSIIPTPSSFTFTVTSSLESPLSYAWSVRGAYTSSTVFTTTEPSFTYNFLHTGAYLLRTTLTAGDRSETASLPVRVVSPVKSYLSCSRYSNIDKSINGQLRSFSASPGHVEWKRTYQDGTKISLPSCSTDAVFHDGYCITTNKSPTSWQAAEDSCANKGGHLINVNSKALYTNLKTKVLDGSSDTEFWIGLNDRSTNGIFTWSTGETIGSDTNWAAGQPDEGSPPEDCVSLKKSGDDWKWHDRKCSDSLSFICQFRLGTLTGSSRVQLIGAGDFGWGEKFTEATEVPKSANSQEKTVIIFPGLWFTKYSEIRAWEFKTTTLAKTAQLRLQVFSPSCPSKLENFTPPGCKTAASPYGICDSAKNDCPRKPECPRYQQLCQLDNSCKNLTEPCNCEEANSYAGCSTTPYRHGGKMPSYKLQREFVIELAKGSPRLVRFAVSGYAQANYVLGISHDSTNNPIYCATDKTSKMRQNYLSFKQSTWINLRETPDGLNAGSWTDDQVCSFRVIANNMTKTFLPDKIAAQATIDGKPGDYTFSGSVHNDLGSTDVQCSTTVMEPVEGLSLLSPFNVPAGTDTTKLSPFSLASDEVQHFLIKISRGSHVSASLMDGETTPMTFADTCPEYFTQALCLKSKTDIEKPFSAVSRTYTSLTTAPTTLTFKVNNKVSSKQLVLKVKICQRLSELVIQNNNNVIKSNTLVTFYGKISKGTCVTYQWKLDDTVITGVSTKTLEKKFSRAGTFKLTLNATNPLGSLTQTLTFTVVTYADPKDAKFVAPPAEALVGIPVSFKILVTVNVDRQFSLVMDYNDDSKRTPIALQATSTPYERTEQHTFSKPGTYTVKANVSDTDTWTIAEHSLLVRFPTLTVKLTTPKSIVPTDVSVKFVAEAKVEVPGYTLKYTWQFGISSQTVTTTSNSNSYVFKNAGTYKVMVTVTTGFNDVSESITIIAVEAVKGLTLEIPGNVFEKTATTFKASVVTGTGLKYIFDTGVAILPESPSPDLVYTYPNSGTYNLQVTAKNSISEAKVSNTVTVLDISYLKLTNFIVPTACSRVDRELSFTASVIHVSIKDLDFSWEFGDGTATQTTKSDPTATHLFTSAGNFSVKVSVKSATKTVQATKVVCVEEPITKITLTPNTTVVGVRKDRPGVISVSIVVTPNSGKYRFTWTFNNVKTIEKATKEKNFIFTASGQYTISLKVENSISSLTQTLAIKVQDIITGVQLQNDLINNKYVKKLKNVAFNVKVGSGSDVFYSWVFGDGSTVDKETTATKTHAYNKVGSYQVLLNVSNLVSYEVVTLEVVVQDPVSGVKLVGDPSPADVNQKVTFTASAATGTDLSYRWRACASCRYVESKSATLSHQFSNTGKHTASVTVRNNVNQATATVDVKVLEKVSMLKIDTNVGEHAAKGAVAQFKATCRGTELTYKWTIKGPNQDTTFSTQTVKFTFIAVGKYDIDVAVTNALGKSDATKTVTVQEKIAGLEISSKRYAPVGDLLTFAAKITSGSDVGYDWDFADGTKLTSTKTTVDHKYTSHGTFKVTVTAKNDVSSMTKSILIGIEVKVSSVDMTGCCRKVLPAGTPTAISATVAAGTNLVYSWTITSDAATPMTLTGRSISPVFPKPTSYKIKLEVKNHISSLSVERTVIVQIRIDKVQIVLQQDKNELFVDQMVNLDVTTSQGSDMKYKWTINGVQNSLTDSSMNRVFKSEGVYSISVTVYNDVSTVTARIDLTIRKLLCELPKLSAVPKTKLEVTKSQEFDLEVDVDTGGCTLYTAKYRWTIYTAGSCGSLNANNIVKLSTEDKVTDSILHVSGGILSVGQYCIVVNVGYADTPVDVSTKFEVEVTASPLKAVIVGGSERLHGNTGSLILDSGSYDPDVIPPGRTDLTYKWTCSAIPPTATPSKACFNQPSTSATLNVPTGSLVSGGQYLFTLSVSDGGSRKKIATQKVIASSKPIPDVQVSCLSCQKSGSYDVQPNRPLVMKGTCTNCNNKAVSYLWIIQRSDGPAVAINQLSSTTGNGKPNLVIKPGVLSNAFSYSVKLTVKYVSSNLEGYALSKLSSANFPSAGIDCQVTPSVMAVLEKPVSVSCTGAKVSVRPDRYRVSMKWTGSTGVKREIVMYYGLNPNTKVYLTHMGSKATSSVTVEVAMENSEGQVKLIKSSLVHVTELAIPSGTTRTEYLRRKIETVFTELKRKGDTAKLLQYSVALVTELNRDKANSKQAMDNKRFIRDCLLEGIDTAAVTSLERIGVIGPIFERLTSAEDEFESKKNEVTNILKRIGDYLAKHLTFGSDAAVTNPSSLANAVSNIIGILLARKTEQGELLAIVKDAQKIFLRYVMVKVPDENPVKFETEGFSYVGSKNLAESLSTSVQLKTGAIRLKPQMIPGSKHREVLQVAMANYQNPYGAGFISGYPITSSVVDFNLYDTEGKEISIKDLSKENSVMMDIGKDAGNDNKDERKRRKREAKTNTVHRNKTLLSKDSIVVRVDSTKLELTGGMGGALSIQIRFSASGSESVSTTGLKLHAFLGVGFKPKASHFTEYKVVPYGMLASATGVRNYTFFVNQSVFDPAKKYYILVQNNNTVSIDLSIAMYVSSCQYYDTDRGTWSNSGCEPLPKSTAAVTVCRCNHLTAFGASVLVAPDAIDFTDLTRLDLVTNPVAIALCGAVLLLYIIVLIWARKRDIKDERKAMVVPLCGRNGPFRYEVTVYTGMMPGAGTTAQVGLKLYGDLAKGDAKHIYRPNAFQRNGEDVVVIASEKNLGDIWQIRVWHDNTGRHPSWFLSHVTVRDLQTSNHWYFPVESWLTINAPYGVVEKKVKAASSHELGKFSQRFRNEAASGFSEKHAWTSLFEHRDHSRFTRVQRITCCVTLFYTFMSANAMWYGLLKNENDRWTDIWSDSFSWEELVVGILSSVIVFPVNILIMQIFRKSRFKLDPMKLKPKNETIEMDDLCTVPREGSVIYDANGNPCRLKRTEALKKIIREESSSDSMRVKENSDIGTWSSNSRSSSAKHREELQKKLQLSGDDPKLWSYDSILQWPEALPCWMEQETDSPPLRPTRRKISNQDSGNDSPEKEKRMQRKSSLARATRRMSIDTLLRFCEEDLDEERELKVGKRVSLIDSKSSSSGTENTRKFSLPRRSRRVSSTTNTLTNEGTETVPSTIMDDDLWSSHPTEISEVSDFGSEYFGSRRTTLGSVERRSTFCRNLSEGEFSLGREETFDYDSASVARSASVMASYGSRSLTSSSSGPTKLTRTISQSLSRIPQMNRRKKQCLLPHGFVYVGYFLCAALSILSIITVILYGHKFGRELALKWLLALFISFLQSAFIMEPLKVICIAIFLALVTKQVDQKLDDNVEVSPLLESNETIKEDKMKPIKGFALLRALDEGRKVHRMQLIIRQSVAYFLFIWLIFVINYANHDTKAYYLTENIYNTLAKSTLPVSGRTLKEIQSTTDVWSWLELVAVPYVHSQGTAESYMYLLGAVRLKQIRGKQENCSVTVTDIVNAMFHVDSCYGSGDFVEDTETYRERWSPSKDGLWKHQDTDDWSVQGTYHRYGGGGYIQTLNSNLTDSMSTITSLKQDNWIDGRTKAVFIDFTVYNANINLYSVVKILFEMGGHAGITSTLEIHTSRFFNFTFGVFNYFDLFMILLIPFFIYLLVHVSLTIEEEQKNYVKNIWNWIELSMTLVMGSSLGMYMFLMHYSTTYLASLKQKTGFVDFGPLAYHHAVFKKLNAVMLFILFCKVAQQFRFIKRWSNYGTALARSLARLLWIFLLFIVLWLVYGMLGYLMLGRGVHGFRSYGASILSLFLALRGRMDFLKPYNHSPWFTGIFFFTYAFLVFGFIFALIIAVLQNTYHLSKSRTKYPCTLDTKDYEMIEFMIDRFKVWAGITKPKKVSRSFRKVKFKGMPSVSTRSTYSSNEASSSGRSVSTTSSEFIERMCRESQYNEQMVERVVPSWEEVVAKMEKLLDDDQKEAKLCSDIARRLIKTALPEKPPPARSVRAKGWPSKSAAKSFIYSSEVSKIPRPPSPPQPQATTSKTQPSGIMKKPFALPRLMNQNTVTPKPPVVPRTQKPRWSTSTSSSGTKSNVSATSAAARGSISTTVSDVSAGKQSNSSHSVVSAASTVSGHSNSSHLSMVSVRSSSSSDDGKQPKRHAADAKPPVAPKTGREAVSVSMPGRLPRPTAAKPRRPQHVLKSVSKNAW